MKMIIKGKEVSVVNVGFVGADNEKRTLHTATCDCGSKIYRASKKESLNHSLTLTAKCCNSKLHYAGEKVFEGDTMADIETAEKVKKERKPRTEKVEKVKGPNPKWIQPKNETVRAGKRGITNQGMIEALLDAGTDENKLTTLFESYPEVFISSAKYLKDSLKPLFESIIHTNENFKEVVLPRRKKA